MLCGLLRIDRAPSKDRDHIGVGGDVFRDQRLASMDEWTPDGGHAQRVFAAFQKLSAAK